MTTRAIDHPDYRPGRGERRSDREIILTGEAADAYQVWLTIWTNRLAGEPPMRKIREDVLSQVIADGGLRGALVLAAVTDATARPLGDGRSNKSLEARRMADYEMAAALRDQYRAAVPPPEPLVPAGYNEETCRHGRSFADECADCGV